MNIYIARQPIFDRKNNNFGYELLFRKNSNNYFIEMDDDIATAELVYNAFLVFGIENITDGSMAFINFSKGLLESDFLEMLPKERLVVEILEREKTTLSTLEACRIFKEKGYILAADDFILSEDNGPLLEFVDIVKISFQSASLFRQAELIKKYKPKVKFLAEKIETRDEYIKAYEMGYDLFQGYFFSKPVMMQAKDIGYINVNILRIIEELNRPEPDFRKIAEIIKMDVGLSYKLLKLVNSAYIAPRYQIKSIQQALGFLGTRELYQWVSLMMLKDIQVAENAEMIKQSLIRGKLMSLLARENNHTDSISEYFFAGIFSQIDAILGRDLIDVLSELPLTDRVKAALLGDTNELRLLLNRIIDFENGAWNDLQTQLNDFMKPDRFMYMYFDAVKWAKNAGSL